MKFAVLLHSDNGQHYGVTVPDLAGCFSSGDGIEEALASAKEAIELHIEGLLEEGLTLPQTAPIHQHQANPDYAGGIWGVVDVDTLLFEEGIEQVAITLPKSLLKRIDDYTRVKHLTRSGFLAEAARIAMR
jgi:predicted RNase H-like HicB family nuclease